MGKDKYANPSFQPTGGAPSLKGNNHDIPAPAFYADIVVGPPSDGIQKNPSVNNPSSAALVNAL